MQCKTSIYCFICRHKFAEAHINADVMFPVVYDFCPTCTTGMTRNFERDMMGLPPLPFVPSKKTRLRVEK